MNAAHTTFLDAFTAISNEVTFNIEWNNGTGYFDFACHDKGIAFDDNGAAKAVSNDGRKLIIVRLPNGKNVVVFERYCDGDRITHNPPRGLDSVTGLVQGSLDEYDIVQLLGNKYTDNIGVKLAAMMG